MGGSQAADVAALEEALSVACLARLAAHTSGERSSRIEFVIGITLKLATGG